MSLLHCQGDSRFNISTKKTQDGSWIGRREMLLVDYIMCSDGKEIINRLPYYFMLVAY